MESVNLKDFTKLLKIAKKCRKLEKNFVYFFWNLNQTSLMKYPDRINKATNINHSTKSKNFSGILIPPPVAWDTFMFELEGKTVMVSLSGFNHSTW